MPRLGYGRIFSREPAATLGSGLMQTEGDHTTSWTLLHTHLLLGWKPEVFHGQPRVILGEIECDRTGALERLMERWLEPAGHPWAALIGFVSVLVSLAHGFQYIAVGNERSANFGNAVHLGMEVNHQFDKGFDFELAAHKYIKEYIARGVHYFSPLQHLWEVQIAQRFCKQPKYLPVFISCNQPEGICHVVPCKSQQHTHSTASQLKDGHGKKRRSEDSRQCGRCEKCVFVYTLLSAHAPAAVKEAFNNKCLFEVEELLPIFKALCGLAQKPMECVGTPEEMRLSLLLAREQRRRIGQTHLPPVFEILHESIDSAQELLWMLDDAGPNSLIPESWKNSD